jgi:hypothetical protein
MKLTKNNVSRQKLLKLFIEDFLWNAKQGFCSPEFDKYRENKKSEFLQLRQLL